MVNLDSRADVLKHDPKDMYGLTCAFPAQVSRALEISRQTPLTALASPPRAVVVAGLGGSAAGGDFVRGLFDQQATLPLFVCRDYDLPSWVGEDTVVFASSYSGNTEETLSAYHQAKERGAKVIVVTSGGKIAELAKAAGDPLIIIPGGQPPRTAMGFMLVPVIEACVQLGLLPTQKWDEVLDGLEKIVTDFGVETIANQAKDLARFMHGRPVVLYGLGSWQGSVAYRWKGQIGENAKAMAFSHSYPELCHNEILGWGHSDEQSPNGWALVTLRDGRESAKMEARARISARLISDHAENRDVFARGESLLERMLTLALIGDYVSLYLAALYEVDPETIDAINTLKAELADVK
jgi:glucose/mannose-6-phosphate isomerase